MVVDLNQLWYKYDTADYVPFYQSSNHLGYISGRLWTLAFGKETDNFYIEPEFEGKPNIDETQLSFNGILVEIPQIKGLVFVVGTSPQERAFVGFYRDKDSDKSYVKLIQHICTFYRNSWCFLVDEKMKTIDKLK